jgi:cation:H+ antiporter
MLFAVILVALLTLVVLAALTPNVTVFAIHPASLVLIAAYLIGLATVRRAKAEPLWIPKKTRETVKDEPAEEDPAAGRTNVSVWTEFAALGLMVSLAGWAIARGAQGIVENTVLGQSLVASLFMGVTNALPETIVSITAVRRGALALAVGSVLGGNIFDVLNLVLGDAAYRAGSLYHAAGQYELFITLATILMTVILLAGMLRRESQGPAGIGWESTLLLATYVLTMVLIASGDARSQ